MKLVIISDTHFGDPAGTLVDNDGKRPGPKFADFAEAAGKHNDFLVLLGDILDFSIESYENAYKSAKLFFEKVKNDQIAKNIIYVPGNHDVDMWNSVQQQIKIMYQVRRGEPALSFAWSLPGFIDDRTNSEHRGFQLPDVIGPVDPNREPSTEKLFLNGITQNLQQTGTNTNFYVAYPNLYMVTDTESIMLTHGHYLEAFWAISSAFVQRLAKDFLGDTDTLVDLVSFNAPLCQLACSGIGQAGNLTPLVQTIQKEAKRGDTRRIDRYCDAVPGVLNELAKDKLIKPLNWLSRLGIKVSTKLVKRELLKALGKREESRGDTTFETREEIKQRFKYYYSVTCHEIDQLNRKHNFNMDPPKKLIYGHTHVPYAWDDHHSDPLQVKGGTVQQSNTGGWLWKEDSAGNRKFCGAEVFVYDTDSGFRSHRIE